VAGYNRIIMMGNLTRDPELRQLPSGQAVCRLSVASNRQFKNKMGTVVQDVCYIDVDVWGPQAESSNQYLRKGRPVLVEGRLKLDTWKENDGQMRSKHSIIADRVVFLGTPQSAETGPDQASSEELSEPVTPATRRGGQASSKSDFGSSPVSGGSPLFKDEPPFEDDLPF
jgi:single-strand DNA-binding protein